MADYVDCACGRGRYNADSYTSCYECYQERSEGMAACIYCGRWHSDEYATCYRCRVVLHRDEAGREIRTYIEWRDEYRCRNCGTTGILNIDHIKPCRWGGGAALWNLQVLCNDCNRVKGATWAPGGSWSQIRRGLYAFYFTRGRHWIDGNQRLYAADDYDAHGEVTRLELWDQWLAHKAMIVDPEALTRAVTPEPGSFSCPQCSTPANTFYGPALVCKACWTRADELRRTHQEAS